MSAPQRQLLEGANTLAQAKAAAAEAALLEEQAAAGTGGAKGGKGGGGKKDAVKVQYALSAPKRAAAPASLI